MNNKCKKTEAEMVGTVAEVKNFQEVKNGSVESGETFNMLAKLWDYNGNVR